jgi:Family of unknown function (DUF5947)
MTGQVGLRRFVRPPAAAAPGPAATTAPAKPEAGPEVSPLVASMLSNAGQRPLPATAAPSRAGLAGQPGTQARQEAAERCELCSTEVAAEHGHIADLEAASLVCACRACYLLFTLPTAGRGKYRAVPDRYLHDPDRVMTPALWDRLEIPVALAFFLRATRSGDELTGFYPSPAGVTECRLDLQLWSELVADFPLLGVPEPDVEAALISRSDAGVEYFLVPIDACYELAGRMRLYWRGFDGGSEARESIAAFLANVRKRARKFSVSPENPGQQQGQAKPGA